MNDKDIPTAQALAEAENEKQRKKKWHIECPNCKTVFGSNKQVLHAVVYCQQCGYDRNKAEVVVKKKGEVQDA